MKTLIKLSLLAAMLALPATSYAQDRAAPKGEGGMDCPMMAGAAGMQKDMGAMMKDMNGMMTGTADPAMKARMGKMHDRMSLMMASMQKMNSGMGMMGAMKGGKDKTVAPPADAKEHDAHHPKP